MLIIFSFKALAILPHVAGDNVSYQPPGSVRLVRVKFSWGSVQLQP